MFRRALRANIFYAARLHRADSGHESQKPPLAVVAPGRVYRPDAVDASHSFMFHQIEGFMVISGLLFGPKRSIGIFYPGHIRRGYFDEVPPAFFPFTEPSAKWTSLALSARAKVVRSAAEKAGWKFWFRDDPSHVFKNVGYDPKQYSGFAFGMGVERIAMLKYGINDIRLFCENDLRFLRQF